MMETNCESLLFILQGEKLQWELDFGFGKRQSHGHVEILLMFGGSLETSYLHIYVMILVFLEQGDKKA